MGDLVNKRVKQTGWVIGAGGAEYLVVGGDAGIVVECDVASGTIGGCGVNALSAYALRAGL